MPHENTSPLPCSSLVQFGTPYALKGHDRTKVLLSDLRTCSMREHLHIILADETTLNEKRLRKLHCNEAILRPLLIGTCASGSVQGKGFMGERGVARLLKQLFLYGSNPKISLLGCPALAPPT